MSSHRSFGNQTEEVLSPKPVVMYPESLSHRNDLSITEPITYGTPLSSVFVHIQFKENRGVLKTVKYTACSLTDTIDNIIREHLQTADVQHVSSTDISLAKIGSGNQERDASAKDRYATLQQLKIKSGDTLYFESSAVSTSARNTLLKVFGPNRTSQVVLKWNKDTTTLKMLLDHVIEHFSLQSIERACIHLLTMDDSELDVISHSNALLSTLGILNDTWIFVDVVEAPSSTSNVHIICAHQDGDLSFDVPLTTTINELKAQIEKRLGDRFLLDFTLFDRMHYTVTLSTTDQRLYDLGVKPGHNVYARLRLAVSQKTASSRSKSLVAKSLPDEVTVSYQTSRSTLIKTQASIHDTVGDMITMLRALDKTDPSTRFRISSGSTIFDNDASHLRLSFYGIRPGDTINVTISKQTSVQHSTSESNRFSTLLPTSGLSTTSRLIETPIGLHNIGNTCYMNSALQCLAHTTPLTQFFLNGLTQSTADDLTSVTTDWNQFYTVGPVTGAYADVVRNLWLPASGSFSYSKSFRPEHIKETIARRAPRFSSYEQQDAQEFMIFLIDEIHKEMKEKHGRDSPTVIEDLFLGTLQSSITCSACGHVETTTNPINFLPLPLTQPGRKFTITFIKNNGDRDNGTVSVPEDGRVRSLIEAFADSHPVYNFFYDISVIANDERVDLDKRLSELTVDEVLLIEEDNFTNSSRFSRYDRKPQRLTLDGCLREFCTLEKLEDSWLCEQEACKKHTTATKQLRFSSLPPILIIQLKRFSHNDGRRDKIETLVEYPIQGLDLSSFLASSSEAIYDLFAVTKHMGSIYGGHYIAYAQHEVNGRKKWHEFDDSWVRSTYSTDDVISRDAYLLFYIRRNQSKPLTATALSSHA